MCPSSASETCVLQTLHGRLDAAWQSIQHTAGVGLLSVGVFAVICGYCIRASELSLPAYCAMGSISVDSIAAAILFTSGMAGMTSQVQMCSHCLRPLRSGWATACSHGTSSCRTPQPWATCSQARQRGSRWHCRSPHSRRDCRRRHRWPVSLLGAQGALSPLQSPCPQHYFSQWQRVKHPGQCLQQNEICHVPAANWAIASF